MIMIRPVLITVVGATCAGKSEFARIADAYGLYCADWGKILHEMIDASETESRTEGLYQVVEYIRKYSRGTVLADFLQRLQREIEERLVVSRAVVLTGARHAADLAYLLGAFPQHRVVLVHADLSIRFSRCIARRRSGDPCDLLSFIKADLQEHIHGLAEVITDFADDVIDNSSDLASYEHEVYRYLRGVLER